MYLHNSLSYSYYDITIAQIPSNLQVNSEKLNFKGHSKSTKMQTWSFYVCMIARLRPRKLFWKDVQ